MNTCVHLGYLAELFSEWEIFHTKVIEKIKTHILCSITFFRKSCRLWDNVEKYGRCRQATDGNIIRRMRFACRIIRATDTHSKYVILTALHGKRAWMLRLYAHRLSSFVKCAHFFSPDSNIPSMFRTHLFIYHRSCLTLAVDVYTHTHTHTQHSRRLITVKSLEPPRQQCFSKL
jgi:hypothetical protein